MKKFFILAILLLFVMNLTPCLAQENDEDIFKKPQPDVIEVDDSDQVHVGDSDKPGNTQQNQEKTPEIPKDKEKEPDQIEKPEVAVKSDEIKEEVKEETTQPGQGNNNREAQVKPEPVIEKPTAVHEEKKNEVPPQAERQIPEPQRTGPTNPQNQANRPGTGNPQPQGRPGNNQQQQQGQPQRNPQQGQPQGQPQRQPQQQQQQPQQPVRQEQPQQPVRQEQQQQQQQQQPVRQEQKKPEAPQPTQQEQTSPQQEYVAPTNRDTEHRNIEVERINDGARHRYDGGVNENEYMKLLGHDPLEYLNHYQEYSESFYNYAEGLFKEALVPLYQQIRANPYLSMGVSFLIGLYVMIVFTRILRSLFKSKPKFRYNREETISQSDINNNFKKFLTELDSLKKQMAGGVANKAGATGEGQAVSAAVPQTLQEDINYIAQSVSKNEETLAKMIKDKSKLDTFLMEFQREVIESHKGIWNELHQLRKVFSQMKVGGGTGGASALRRTTELKDTVDDTKSLSSNPEANGQRRVEESTRPVQKMISEPRSKSVAPGESAMARPKQIPQKEKRPSEIETERRPSFPHPVNGGQESAKSQKEEEPQVKNQVQTPSVEKTTAQVPFGKVNKEGGEEPGIPIPTDKSSTQNPFAPGGQIGANGNPGLPVGQKPNPFGNRGKPGMVKAPITKQFPPVQNATVQNPVENQVQTSIPEANPGQAEQVNTQENIEAKNGVFEETKTTVESENTNTEVTDDTQGTPQEEINTDSTANTKPFAPVNKMGMPGAGINRPGVVKPGVPGGKQFPAPQIRKVGMPGANVYKGPPGNLPRPGMPTQVRPTTTGAMPESGSGGNSQV